MHTSITKALALSVLTAPIAFSLPHGPTAIGPGETGTVYALTQRFNRLLTFQAGTPGTIDSQVAVSGLQAGETLVGIDFRPSTGDLYALSDASRLYRIDLGTGAATEVGTGPFAPPLAGGAYGFDFNPVAGLVPDRIRVVSDSDQNLRLHPDTGAVAGTDTPLAYAAGDPNAGADPELVASAYTSNFAGATSTTLYGIDATLGILVRQGSPGGAPISPNSGQLFTIGQLNVATDGLAGFDVSPYGGALASLSQPGGTRSRLYTINLDSGAAAVIGPIGGGFRVRDIAVAPPSQPRIFGLTTTNQLVSFRPGAPGTPLATVPLTGLQPGEQLLGFDFRPATGDLVALGSTNRLYDVDPASGAAVSIGTFTPALTGERYGVDFNPVPDRLRVVSDADENLRLNPNNGALAGTDTPLAYAAGDPNAGADPNVVAAAYTNSFSGASATTLFDIDSDLDVLVRQGSDGGTPVSPNSGQLFTIGALGVDTTGLAGFDISAFGGVFASLTAPAFPSSQLYTINLGTGVDTLVGTIGAATLRDIAIEPPSLPRVFAVTTGNNLISFAPGTPGSTSTPVAITGLKGGESIRAIDLRPATGRLLALGSTSRLYTLDTASGAATPIGSGPFTPALAGLEFGLDFNPTVDRLRLVSDAEQNLRLNPDSGAVAGTDTPLAYATGDVNFGVNPTLVASAYTANFAGSFSTTLFGLDTALDVLVRQGSPGGSPVSPNSGQLFTIGGLGMDASDVAGFDISYLGGAFAAFSGPAATSSTLFQINLTTGAATAIGTIGGPELVRAIAVR